jgi:hypothetical protein
MCNVGNRVPHIRQLSPLAHLLQTANTVLHTRGVRCPKVMERQQQQQQLLLMGDCPVQVHSSGHNGTAVAYSLLPVSHMTTRPPQQSCAVLHAPLLQEWHTVWGTYDGGKEASHLSATFSVPRGGFAHLVQLGVSI